MSNVKLLAASRISEKPLLLTDCLKIKMKALRSFKIVVNIFGSNRYNIPKALDFCIILDTDQTFLNSINMIFFFGGLSLRPPRT